MNEIQKLSAYLNTIDTTANEIIALLRRLKFTADLYKLDFIPRDRDTVGPIEIENYQATSINEYDRELQLTEILRSLKRGFRTDGQLGSNRLIGIVTVDTTKDMEVSLVELVHKLNASKANVGSWLNENYSDMNKRMEFINRPTSPLYNTIMPTIHRKIQIPDVIQGLRYKSVTFSWCEKGFKSYKICNSDDLTNHLKHYGCTSDVGALMDEFTLNAQNPWTVLLPQRVHPVVNITITNSLGAVVKRSPLKAHTPIFTFSSQNTRIKPFIDYQKRSGLIQPGPQYQPIRSDLSLYKKVAI